MTTPNSPFYALIRETKKGHTRAALMYQIPGTKKRMVLGHRVFYAYGINRNFISNDNERWNAAKLWAQRRVDAMSTGMRTETIHPTTEGS